MLRLTCFYEQNYASHTPERATDAKEATDFRVNLIRGIEEASKALFHQFSERTTPPIVQKKPPTLSFPSLVTELRFLYGRTSRRSPLSSVY